MSFVDSWVSFKDTDAFSDLAVNYLEQNDAFLQPFYKYHPNLDGLNEAIKTRGKFKTNRAQLVKALSQQYEGLTTNSKVLDNIEKLQLDTTFTITTAHQPNIFTGYLYFVYKIVQAIKLAETLNGLHKELHFVPVYYMGSEDNDLAELNHIYLGNEKISWDTKQAGAVGRMHTKGLEKMLHRINGELSVQPYGKVLVKLLQEAYLNAPTVQEATLRFTNALFQKYGLVVLIPDNVAFKQQMIPIFKEDLLKHTPSTIVQETANALTKKYHAQVNPRSINLFYLKDDIRERIIKEGDKYLVNNTSIAFTEAEILDTLHSNPELFSPNVVLRGMMQEKILPNIAFIGGGSEIAYWLELKEMFTHFEVPFPVLLLRNSFLLVNNRMYQLCQKLGIDNIALFTEEDALIKKDILAHSNYELTLDAEIAAVTDLYNKLRIRTTAIDNTLSSLVSALESKAKNGLHQLEKKMLKAAKKKDSTRVNQIKNLKATLFPSGKLQERLENILPYYAKYGESIIDVLYKVSPGITNQFGIIKEI